MAVTAPPQDPPPHSVPTRTALGRWGVYVARHPRRVIWATLAALIGFAALAPIFLARLLGVGYDTPGTDSARAGAIVSGALGSTEAVLVVVSSESRTATDLAFARVTGAALAVAAQTKGVAAIPPADLGGATSPDAKVIYRSVLLSGDAGERQKTSKVLAHDLAAIDTAALDAADLRIGLSGESPFFVDLLHAEEEGLAIAEAVGLPLALLVLFFTLGSVLAAGLPILIGLAGVVVALGILGFLSLFTTFDIFAENGVIMVGLAVGIDYALLIVRRFREEREQHDVETATAITMASAGRTVLFSGATVVFALLPMAVIDVPTLSKFAFAGLLGVAAAIVMALVLLPAVLVRLGDRALRVRLRRMRERGFAAGGGSPRWESLARAVMRRAWLVLGGVLALLILAAAPLAGAKAGIDLNVRAFSDEPSVQTLATLQQAFPAISLGKVEIAVLGGEDARLATEGLLADEGLYSGVRSQFLSEGAYLITADLAVPNDAPQAEAVVERTRTALETGLPAGAEAFVGGITARSIDYADEVASKTAVVLIFTMALCFLLLLVMLRSPLLSLKAVITNLLGIAAAMGLTVLVFQEGYGESLLDFTSPGYLQAWMPLTLFVVLFGLSMDYEVFLVSRMREEYLRTGNNTEAVAAGLARTGGVITSAALIMIAIFGAFMLSPAPEIKQLGFGLAVAILIDATIIRALLVPAFMRIAGDWNWWCPRWLDRALPKVGEHP
ncbi:MAG: MMPL family transporter [Sporichthyaceae bacterium]